MATKIIRFPHERTRAATINRLLDQFEQLHRFAMDNRAARRELFKPISFAQRRPSCRVNP